jgi:hypothetical protein
MKRKIEKFLAAKQGIELGSRESLPVGEDGRIDFMGDLEGVLQVRYKCRYQERCQLKPLFCPLEMPSLLWRFVCARPFVARPFVGQ